MDRLSEVLALMEPQVYVSGNFVVLGDMAIHFPKHQAAAPYATGAQPENDRGSDMALFKRGGVWWYKFYFAGNRSASHPSQRPRRSRRMLNNSGEGN